MSNGKIALLITIQEFEFRTDIYLGILWSQTPGNPDAWSGGIDDFKIWNAALGADQIAACMKNQKT